MSSSTNLNAFMDSVIATPEDIVCEARQKTSGGCINLPQPDGNTCSMTYTSDVIKNNGSIKYKDPAISCARACGC